jgi:UDPglucose--hexose-1-phosphate uridylyltransferase
LTDEWVLCSPHRASRPWLGQRESVRTSARPRHDPACYLCAGNRRASGERNPNYSDPFVFENDFRALLDNRAASPVEQKHSLLERKETDGTCRVICFTPRHDLTLAQMTVAEIIPVIRTWVEQTRELGSRYRWVQIFENKGEAMGCSNPHPHGQIWAMNHTPTLPAKENRCQVDYFAVHGRKLLLDYAALEIEQEERVVCLNSDWLVVVPYWATWPFETLLLPRFPLPRLSELSEAGYGALAAILQELLIRYDNLFACEFPYSMGWHGAPFTPSAAEPWQAHAHFYPPLLRSATVRKFMVGFEMMAEAQRDITPEDAAAQLREVPAERFVQHFS